MLNPPFRPKYSRASRWAARGRGGALYYPIWLAYATGILKQSGHCVRLVDAPAWGWDSCAVLDDILNFHPDIVVVETNFQSFTNDVNIAKECTLKTDSISVAVGPPCSQFPEKILNSGINFVIEKEFDFILNKIVNNIENEIETCDIEGISYIKDGKIIKNPRLSYSTSTDLDEIPFVSKIYKEHLNIHDYFLNHAYYPMVQIITSRGCPNLCSFCSWPETLMGRKYRSRSVDNIFNEFIYIKEELPEVQEIVIEDDTFTVRKNRVREFCNKLIESGFDIHWGCQTRGDLDIETMQLMKKAGCSLLDVGFESGSEQILQNIKKGITKEQLRLFTDNAKKAKMKILADFVIGFEGETKETISQTVDFIDELKPDLLQVAIATPIPGTHFYEWAKEKGYMITDNLEDSLDEYGFQRCIISYPTLSSNEIESTAKKVLNNYYLSPKYPFVAFKAVLKNDMQNELKLLMRSFRCFLQNQRIENAE